MIEWGEADVSAEHITGEALPARRAPREEVPAGARALDGTLVVRATRPAAQSTLARIAQLARQARVRFLAPPTPISEFPFMRHEIECCLLAHIESRARACAPSTAFSAACMPAG